MSKRSLAPLAAIGLLVVQMGLAGHAVAQSGSVATPSATTASADAYVYGCGLLTGTDRLACFDLLPWRIGADQGLFSWLGNTSASSRAHAQAPVSQQFIGTAQPVPARPFAFLEDFSPL